MKAFSTLRQRIADILAAPANIRALEARIAVLQTALETVDDTVDDVKSDLDDLQDDVKNKVDESDMDDAIERATNDLDFVTSRDFDDLTGRVDDLETFRTDVENLSVEDLVEKVEDVSETVDALKVVATQLALTTVTESDRAAMEPSFGILMQTVRS